MRIIFLDIDGVLNCQLFYESQQYKDYRDAKKTLKKQVKSDEIEQAEYYSSQLCKERISWLNSLCESTGAKVVISSTWRAHGLEKCQKILSENGATFEMIGVTPQLRHEGCVRGNEIYHWIKENESIIGKYYDYKDYAIIDDDSDMLLWQREHFFQTDNYSGLTPTTCYKIQRFFTGKTFEK